MRVIDSLSNGLCISVCFPSRSYNYDLAFRCAPYTHCMLHLSVVSWPAQVKVWWRGPGEPLTSCQDPAGPDVASVISVISVSCAGLFADTNYVLANYKTEQCKRPPRLCRQGYACPSFHNTRDKRRSPKKFKYRFVLPSRHFPAKWSFPVGPVVSGTERLTSVEKVWFSFLWNYFLHNRREALTNELCCLPRSTPCPNVKHGDDWGDPTQCENGENCPYCHTRTEQQFHPEVLLQPSFIHIAFWGKLRW